MEINPEMILENARLLLKEGNYREVKSALMPYLNNVDPTDPEARLYFNLANLDGEIDEIKEFHLKQAIEQNFARAREAGISHYSDFVVKNSGLIKELLENKLEETMLVDVGDSYFKTEEAFAKIMLKLIFSSLDLEEAEAQGLKKDFWYQVKSLVKSNIFKHVPLTIKGEKANQDDLLQEIEKAQQNVQKDS